jgi:hypothetical protein
MELQVAPVTDDSQVYVSRRIQGAEAEHAAVDSQLGQEVLAESRRQRRRIVRGVTALLTSWAMLYVFLWLYETIGLTLGWILPEGVIGPFLFASFLGSMALCAYFSLPSERQKQSLRELAKSADVSAIGPIVEMVREIQPRHTRRALRAALAELAPRLKESDMQLLTTVQRRKIHHLLHDSIIYDRDPAFAITLLKGMEQIGDEQTVRTIGKAMSRAGRGEKWKRIRAAANEAIAVIEVRLARIKSPSILLRPAEAEGADLTLLRPAGEGQAYATELLLRASAEGKTVTIE